MMGKVTLVKDQRIEGTVSAGVARACPRFSLAMGEAGKNSSATPKAIPRNPLTWDEMRRRSSGRSRVTCSPRIAATVSWNRSRVLIRLN